MKRASRACGTALVLLSSLAFGQAFVDRKVAFDLVVQPLAEALNEFAAQSNLRIVFNTEDAKGLVSERLSGTFTPRAALKILLGSSKLQYQFVDDRTVEVRSGKETQVNSIGK